MRGVLQGRGSIPGDQFASCRLKTPHHHFAHAFKQFVAESEIFVAMLPQHYAGKTNGGACLSCSRIKLPEVGREKPRPSQRFTSRDSIDNDRFPIARFSLEHNGSSLNQIKPVCWLTCSKDDLARIELRRHRAKSQELEVMRTHPLEEGMSSQSPFNIWIANRERFAP